MTITLKTKIWLTVLTIVLMFSFFTLYYFPNQQAKLLLNNYNNEVQNLANTVSLGVKIAMNEQNFEGVETAMQFVKGDSRLEFISMLQADTVWSNNHVSYKITEKVFKTFPENSSFTPASQLNDSVIVKKSPFTTSAMSGAIVIGFSTKAINEGKQQIKLTSLLVSGIVFVIGIILGFWLSKTISKPVLALRNAALRVGEGDFNQRVSSASGDEIADLGKAFNRMVEYLAKATKKLNEANQSLETTNATLNNTVEELKSTQAQLVQAEKMASLGELTAGIAHEIQNPLNFVNNFSEVSKELLDEMKTELANGNIDDANAIAGDVILNLDKILHHGKRADAIVKGMLQHSRSSSGKNELTDINALADEYLRLSYHGLRAKDKSFNADFKTEFDESIGKIIVIPQDIGRVFLNLLNNAFYSVNKKKQSGTVVGYEPTVTMRSGKEGNNIVIAVHDNGLGISKAVMDKIYQPFFTTKPTGEGTGLGLSMCYDIITTSHNGKLDLKTEEGEFAEFIITLPVS